MEKVSAEFARKVCADWLKDESDPRYEKISNTAWTEGYVFGYNERADYYNRLIAMLPPPPIVINTDGLSLKSLKTIVMVKIKNDSQGKWWLKLKLWWRFLWID